MGDIHNYLIQKVKNDGTLDVLEGLHLTALYIEHILAPKVLNAPTCGAAKSIGDIDVRLLNDPQLTEGLLYEEFKRVVQYVIVKTFTGVARIDLVYEEAGGHKRVLIKDLDGRVLGVVGDDNPEMVMASRLNPENQKLNLGHLGPLVTFM